MTTSRGREGSLKAVPKRTKKNLPGNPGKLSTHLVVLKRVMYLFLNLSQARKKELLLEQLGPLLELRMGFHFGRHVSCIGEIIY